MANNAATGRTGAKLREVDPVWNQVRKDAEAIVEAEPAMASFVIQTVLNEHSLEEAVCHRVVSRLDHGDVSGELVRQAFDEVLATDGSMGEAFRADLMAIYDRDPACSRLIDPLLYFKGFHALQTQRLAHRLWLKGRRDLAYYLQSRASTVFQVDIHPAVPIGRGIMLDHATGLVVGETAVIEDDVSILHNVTLGGTGKAAGDRHPKIRRGVMIGAGAKILGNIEVGACSRVAAGSVVLRNIPPKSTVVGVPAKVVGVAECMEPSRVMDQFVASEDD
ncbi:MAG: serine O-acetyltransferase [Rhodobiaceae bacterium]|nr:serine O-acetyltransferase [Rhodobiaceae bacterium]